MVQNKNELAIANRRQGQLFNTLKALLRKTFPQRKSFINRATFVFEELLFHKEIGATAK